MINTKRLKSILAREGLTSLAFGEKMGWKRSTTYRKVNGVRPFTVPEVDTARQVLNLNPVDVMEIFFESYFS